MATPIACSLDPSRHRDRMADLSALAARALRAREPIPGGQRLAFAGGDDLERELRAVVAAEAACCAFLTLRLERREGRLELDVTGPPDARPIIDELFA